MRRIERLLEALARELDPHTTVSDRQAALETHVADSLSGLVVDELRGARRIADIGAGAGFPGLILAVALPRSHVDLLESAGRKTAVISRLAHAAEIGNARAVTARAEDWARTPPALGGGREGYDAVTARALGALAVLCEYAAPLLREEGVLVAWKGARSEPEEAGGAEAAGKLGLAVEDVRRVTPFAGARERHLHVFRKVAATPAGFPRRVGRARKRPLG